MKTSQLKLCGNLLTQRKCTQIAMNVHRSEVPENRIAPLPCLSASVVPPCGISVETQFTVHKLLPLRVPLVFVLCFALFVDRASLYFPGRPHVPGPKQYPYLSLLSS
jgi:hypothetical protein